MERQWTENQRQVIDARDRNLLVSAAAGSGKTAVLVEHILSLVLDKDRPVDIDRMLVVTFTKAAAAEMRERIGQELERRLALSPEDDNLQRQMTLLHHGQICTIDSFCTYILRNYFYEIDMDPGFRVADEGELRLLKEDVVKELLEAYYEKADPQFLEFIEYFATGRGDENIEALILKLYGFADSHPDPEGWLLKCRDAYEPENVEQIRETPVGRLLTAQVSAVLEGLAGDCRELAQLICQEDGPGYYLEAFRIEQETVEKMRKTADWDKWYEALRDRKSKRLLTPKSAEGSEEKRLQAAEKIRQIREALKSLQADYFAEPPEKIGEELALAKPAVSMLIELTLGFRQRFAEKKKEKNILDFSDLEHGALAVFTDEEGKPTETALRFREYFEEIMIDEYQDSNLLQERILTAISRGNNLFMVGDVKQSIYRFRKARPELFTEKLARYTKEISPNQTIGLGKNFRSRRQVLDSVNRVFENLMQKEVGGVAYDEEAALFYGAGYEREADDAYRTEVLHFSSENLSEEARRPEAIDGEASMIASRIFALTDKKTGLLIQGEEGERIARYRDIVILLRSQEQWAERFVDVLMEEGIPAYAQSSAGFYETREIQTIYQYLCLIDNERQEIPLAAALASPIGNMTSAELAMIRIAFPHVPFYEAAKAYSQYGTEEGLRDRLQLFYDRLAHFRDLVPYTQIHELLWNIYDETGFYHYAASMPGGTLRQANLDLLVDQAISFEATSYKGLFHFLRYVEQIRKYEIDIGEASAVQESMDAVRIMTIHKSKGLEFPIVFVAGLGKQFNDQDERQSVVLHSENGIGIDIVDPLKRLRYVSVFKQVLKRQNHLENRGEELRVLYVAMTRAKEKLILTGVHNEKDVLPEGPVKKPGAQDIVNAAGMWQWLCKIVGTDPNVFLCREMTPDSQEPEQQGEPERALREAAPNTDSDAPGGESGGTQGEAARLKELLTSRLRYEYPYGGRAYHAKLSVSELKKRSGHEQDDGQGGKISKRLYEDPVPVPYIPGFAAETKENRGAERGSAYHKLLECFDYTLPGTSRQIKAFLEDLVAEGKMTAEWAKAIDPEDIVGFLQSGIGKRMRKAALAGCLKREQPFVIGIPANEIYGEAPKEEQLLIQGIIDAYFVEDGQIVIVDYKTDRVSGEKGEEQLLELYRVQLASYARALTQLTCMPVKEACIYSFALGREIPCTLPK